MLKRISSLEIGEQQIILGKVNMSQVFVRYPEIEQRQITKLVLGLLVFLWQSSTLCSQLVLNPFEAWKKKISHCF